MIFPDVNILLGAFQVGNVHHPVLARWLSEASAGQEALGISEFVLSSVVRISTNHRVWPTPATPEQAVGFCEELRTAPSVVLVAPGADHWAIFADLVTQHRLRDNDVPDAYLAALALENRATFVTRDRGFARFAGLKLLDPTG